MLSFYILSYIDKFVFLTLYVWLTRSICFNSSYLFTGQEFLSTAQSRLSQTSEMPVLYNLIGYAEFEWLSLTLRIREVTGSNLGL
jgi:hypothetical protein